MQIDDYVNKEIRYRIPVILLNFLGDFKASTAKHLEEASSLLEGWIPVTAMSQVRDYVESRIKNDILVKYNELSVKPEALKGQWHELIMEYRTALADADEALDVIRKIQVMRCRSR